VVSAVSWLVAEPAVDVGTAAPGSEGVGRAESPSLVARASFTDLSPTSSFFKVDDAPPNDAGSSSPLLPTPPS